MKCAGTNAGHDGLDVRLVKLYLRRELRPLCRGCRADLATLGMDFTVDESDRRPAWLANLTPKDFTGRAA